MYKFNCVIVFKGGAVVKIPCNGVEVRSTADGVSGISFTDKDAKFSIKFLSGPDIACVYTEPYEA